MEEWNKVDFQFPSIPTMISKEEQQYLYWLGAKFWEGKGNIIEIGPWLGGSTYCLALGMSQNPNKSIHKLHVYDNFIWREFMSKRAPLELQPGDSFRDYFIENIKPFEGYISHYKQSLPDEIVANDNFADAGRQYEMGNSEILTWESEKPVEILFIDGAKSWSGMKHLFNIFYKSIIPGKTLIVCQDYKYWGAYWVIIIIEILFDHLEVFHNLSFNTVTFKVITPIDSQKIDSINDYKTLNVEQGIKYINRASQRLLDIGDKNGFHILQLSKIRLLVHKDRMEDAILTFRKSEASWPLFSIDNNLETARKWLETESKKALPPLAYSYFRRKFYSGALKIKGLLK
ncbi:MAG TPA: hypothetical protein VD908_04020 [Cytophagales bacterium]|nr:hypothetical protein [Cytophagales bacterium]